MKRLIFFIGLIILSVTGFSQKPFLAPSGIKIGKIVSGTNIFQIDSMNQYSTDQYRLYKGATLMSPFLPLNFKLNGTATSTIGNNMLLLTNPGAVTFPRFNANNTVTPRTAAEMRADLNVPLGSDTVTGSTLVYLKAQTDSVARTKTLLAALQGFGSTIKALPINATAGSMFYSSNVLVDGNAENVGFYLSEPTLITGAAWVQQTAGSYVANNYNGFKLYSISGTTYTREDSTANTGNLWTATANTLSQKAFTEGAKIYPAGAYYLSFIWNTSDGPPAVVPRIYSNINISGAWRAIVTNKIGSLIPNRTDLPYPTFQSNTAGLDDAVYQWTVFLY